MNVTVTAECPECGDEIEVEGDVLIETQRHPYGSTTAEETLIEVETEGGECPECGFEFTPDHPEFQKVDDRLAEYGQDLAYEEMM